MATSKEQPGKEQPRNEEVYSNEDRKLIISLLNEYSEKLLHVCDQIDKYQKILRLFILLLAGLTYPVIFAEILVPNASWRALFSEFLISSLFLLISLGFIVSLSIYDTVKRVALLKRDARTLSLKLEKVIRIASQAQEHILSNFVSRIELDLRLADAESALEHYSVMMKTRV